MSETGLSAIATAELLRLLPTLLGEERGGMVRFLVHLAEFDRRRGWEALGYGNLWDYCARELRLQKGCIFRRTHTVGLLQRFSGIEQRLLSGALSMTTLLVLEKILTENNCEEMLMLAEWKSKEELGDLVAARMAPKVAPAPMVRKMPSAAATAGPTAKPEPVLTFSSGAQDCDDVAADASVATIASLAVPDREVPVPVAPRGAIDSTPLGDDRYLFRGVAGRAFREKLRRAQEIESHAVPDGDPIKVIERALDLLIEKHAKRVAAIPRVNVKAAEKKSIAGEDAELNVKGSETSASVAVPRKGRPHIPVAVERAVRTRDGDCCSFVLADGSRCESRWRTELDHVEAFALGGEASVVNLRVVCRSHNVLHARQTFGDEVTSRYGRAGSSGGTPNREREALRQTASPK